MTLGERITDRLEAIGMSQAELARRVGIKQPSINHLIHKGAGGSAHLHKIARELRTSVEYLTGESDDPSPVGGVEDRQIDYHSETDAALDRSVEVQELDLAYGMGGTFLEDVPVKASTVRFTREWLRNFTDAKPDDLFFARGIGDSMMPTILDSDIVLIDRSQDTMRMNDQIWALSFGGMGMIKRLRSMPDGSLRILSDNANVPEDRAHDEEAYLIGRVVAVVRKI